jgi:hypothetical protein
MGEEGQWLNDPRFADDIKRGDNVISERMAGLVRRVHQPAHVQPDDDIAFRARRNTPSISQCSFGYRPRRSSHPGKLEMLKDRQPSDF